MLNYTTLQAKRQKRKHIINLINSLLLKTSPKSLPISYSISYPITPKGPLQASPIPSFPDGEATRTFIQ